MSETEQDKLQKRGRSLAAMGLVNRDGDKFTVITPSLRGQQVTYKVRRDDKTTRILCDCLNFQDRSENEPAFLCEHILAVKFYLIAKMN